MRCAEQNTLTKQQQQTTANKKLRKEKKKTKKKGNMARLYIHTYILVIDAKKILIISI